MFAAAGLLLFLDEWSKSRGESSPALAGAAGNLLDIPRSRHVIDFIDLAPSLSAA
jgi:lipoprotein signal peptidase